MTRQRANWLFGVVAAAAVGALLWRERRRPLRPSSAPTGERAVTNLALAGLTAITAQVAMTPVVAPLARWVERERAGLVQQLRRLGVPAWACDAVAVILLDYTLYWWHVAEHRIRWLYRFHQVHHSDLALDASTAARFHFGEFLTSVPWRAAQILTLGVTPRALAAWNRLTMLSVVFHHSNARLSMAAERRLARVIMTPRLHGIHHSIVRDEQNSNWSSGLTLWDRLHGTYRLDVAQAEITIGIPALREPEDVTLARSVALPFERALPPWRLPDGTVPTRTRRAAPE